MWRERTEPVNKATGSKPPTAGRPTQLLHPLPSRLTSGRVSLAQVIPPPPDCPHTSATRVARSHTHSILHRGRNWNTGQTSLEISSAHPRKLPWEHPQRNIHDPWGQLPRLLLGSLHLTHLFSQTLVVFLRPLPELAGNRQCVRASPTRNTHTGTLLTTYLQ